MGSFTLGEASIIGLFLEALLYGIYIITLGYSLRVLLYQPGPHVAFKESRDITWWLVCVIAIMAILLTLDLVLFLRYNLVAFVLNAGFESPDAAFLSQNWIKVVRNADYVVLTTIGDAILIYRMFRLYGGNYLLAALPFLMYLAGIACGIVIVSKGIAKNALPAATLQALEFTAFSITVAINVFATSLIIAKLWRTRARVYSSSSNPDRLLHVGRIVLDSGLMYTIASILILCTIPMPNLADCISDATIQIIGIAFNLIIIRLNSVMRSSTRSDRFSIVQPPHSSATDRRRTVVSHGTATPLSTFRIIANQHTDTPTDKSAVSDAYDETWKRGSPSLAEP